MSIEEIQERIGTEPDGFWGPASIRAVQRHLKSLMPTPNPWPQQHEESLQSFYGSAGDESKLVSGEPPVPMYYEGKRISALRCHKLVFDSLCRALSAAYNAAPKFVEDYAGCYNFRLMRGGSRYSLHARGAAIDLSPSTNGNRTHWPTVANMPITVMEAFAREGWLSAGVMWGRDAMHFQATQ